MNKERVSFYMIYSVIIILSSVFYIGFKEVDKYQNEVCIEISDSVNDDLLPYFCKLNK